MSRDAVVGFLRRMDGDAALREQLERALVAQGHAVATLVTTAASLGFEFTAEEFAEAAPAIGARQGGELSDADLAGVSGGVGAGLATRFVGRISTLRVGPGAGSIRPGGGLVSEEEELSEP